MRPLKLPVTDLSKIKSGDIFTRTMGYPTGIPMFMMVVDVIEDIIYAVPRDLKGSPFENLFDDPKSWYKFDKKTGMEIDDDLAWGPSYGVTGTYITQIHNE